MCNTKSKKKVVKIWFPMDNRTTKWKGWSFKNRKNCKFERNYRNRTHEVGSNKFWFLIAHERYFCNDKLTTECIFQGDFSNGYEEFWALGPYVMCHWIRPHNGGPLNWFNKILGSTVRHFFLAPSNLWTLMLSNWSLGSLTWPERGNQKIWRKSDKYWLSTATVS